VVTVVAFDVNETLLDLGALDEPFRQAFGDPALRPQWFAQMLQLSFVGGLTGQYVDFTSAQHAALRMLAERTGTSLSEAQAAAIVGDRARSMRTSRQALSGTSPPVTDLAGRRHCAARNARLSEPASGPSFATMPLPVTPTGSADAGIYDQVMPGKVDFDLPRHRFLSSGIPPASWSGQASLPGRVLDLNLDTAIDPPFSFAVSSLGSSGLVLAPRARWEVESGLETVRASGG
jgi:hypothetical protein